MISVLYLCRARKKELPMLELLRSERKINLTVVAFHGGAGNPFRFLSNLYIERRNIRSGVIISEGLGVLGLIAVLVGKVSGSKVLVRVKGDAFAENRDVQENGGHIQKFYKRFMFTASLCALRYCDCISPISINIDRILRERGYRNVGRILYIPSPHEAGDSFVGKPAKRVITVTNFNFKEKNKYLPSYIEFIGPFFQNLGIVWDIIGDGRYREYYENHKAAQKYSGIRFVGEKDANDLYGDAIILLYISGLDALSNVVLEALAYGIPVIVNKEMPVDEWKNANDSIGLISYRDEVESITTISKYVNDEYMRRNTVINGYKLLARFKVKSLSEEMYQQIVDLIPSNEL